MTFLPNGVAESESQQAMRLAASNSTAAMLETHKQALFEIADAEQLSGYRRAAFLMREGARFARAMKEGR